MTLAAAAPRHDHQSINWSGIEDYDELTRQDQWCAWYEKGDHKIPVNPTASLEQDRVVKGDHSDPSSFGSYRDAKQCCLRFELDGVGFLLMEPYCGIDLDHCLDDQGRPDAWARAVANLFYVSVWDVSPSGTGLKLIIKARKPGKWCKESEKKTEIYDHKRWFTVTGNSLYLQGQNQYLFTGFVPERQEQLNRFYDHLWPSSTPSINGSQDTSSSSVPPGFNPFIPLSENSKHAIDRLQHSIKWAPLLAALRYELEEYKDKTYPTDSEEDGFSMKQISFHTTDTGRDRAIYADCSGPDDVITMLNQTCSILLHLKKEYGNHRDKLYRVDYLYRTALKAYLKTLSDDCDPNKTTGNVYQARRPNGQQQARPRIVYPRLAQDPVNTPNLEAIRTRFEELGLSQSELEGYITFVERGQTDQWTYAGMADRQELWGLGKTQTWERTKKFIKLGLLETKVSSSGRYQCLFKIPAQFLVFEAPIANQETELAIHTVGGVLGGARREEDNPSGVGYFPGDLDPLDSLQLERDYQDSQNTPAVDQIQPVNMREPEEDPGLEEELREDFQGWVVSENARFDQKVFSDLERYTNYSLEDQATDYSRRSFADASIPFGCGLRKNVRYIVTVLCGDDEEEAYYGTG